MGLNSGLKGLNSLYFFFCLGRIEDQKHSVRHHSSGFPATTFSSPLLAHRWLFAVTFLAAFRLTASWEHGITWREETYQL
jgi:hypothetical protein